MPQNASPALPDFIIVGTQKGGTSSVYNTLIQHPQITAASKKEVHFFDRNHNRGEAWYSRHFSKTDGKITGEATPFYLFHPRCAERIAALLPRVKIIILLRDPTMRAYSHYQHMVRRGLETLDFEAALEAEEKRTAAGWQKVLSGEAGNSSPLQQFSYRRRGLYLEQILRYENFFSPGQLHIDFSERFYQNPLAFVASLYRFLDVDDHFEPADLIPRKPGNYAIQHQAALKDLSLFYKPYNDALFRHIGKSMTWGIDS